MRTALIPMGEQSGTREVTMGEWLATFDLIREMFANYELPAPKFGRLVEYERVIRAAAFGNPDPNFPSPDQFSHTLLEVRQLRLIAQQIGTRELPGARDLVQRAMGGNPMPTEDGENAKARDSQFELFLAASFLAAGYKVRIDEPDLIVTVGELELAVAAKRLRSARLLQANVRKAVKQIIRSRHMGIVALEISCMGEVPEMVPPNYPLSFSMIQQCAHRVLREAVARGTVEVTQVPAVLICAALRFDQGNGLPYGTGIDWQLLYLPGARPEHKLVLDVVLRGLQNDISRNFTA